MESDVLIASMFGKSQNLTITADIMTSSRVRQELGNPPGKQGSIGDSVHWETLLDAPDVRYLDIVSRDGDFESELNSGQIKSFLSDEWKGTKRPFAKVSLFKSLSGYFKRRYPKIKLSDETQKIELIEELRSSPNFATTHDIVAQLDCFEYFTRAQIGRLFEILCENPQVGRIGADVDVKSFYLKFKDDSWLLPESLQEKVAEALVVEEDFFLPF